MRLTTRRRPASANQEQFLAALATGATRTDAARIARIDRRDVARAMDRDPELRLAVEKAEERGRAPLRMRGRLGELTGTPLATLAATIPATSHKRRFRQLLASTPSASLLVMLLTLLIHGVRLTVAPDFLADEGSYLGVAQHVAQGKGLTELNGAGFFWHPPLFPLLEAGVLKVLGLEAADPVQALDAVRWINVVVSALTAGLLFLFVRRLSGRWASWAVAALFIIDPYIQRINRRNMLESLTVLLLVAGFALAYTHRDRLTPSRRILAGLAFGLAILTKEIAAVILLGLLLHAVWHRRSQVVDAVQIVMVASATYLLYPLWALQTGQFDRYLDYRLDGIARYLNLGSTPSIPGLRVGGGPSTPERLLVLLPQYAMTYLLLGLGAVFLVVLLIAYRHRPAAQYVACWAIAAYATVGFGITVGQLSDQLFYFLIVPAVVVVGIVTSDALRAADVGSILRTVLLRRPSNRSRTMRLAFVALLLFVLPLYNANEWIQRYLVGNDDGYTRITEYVHDHLRPGTQIMVGSDVANYILPGYRITFQRDTQSIIDTKVRYFILSSKDAWAGYHGMSKPLYDWIRGRTKVLVALDGTTFWHIGLYELTTGTAAR